MSENEQVISVAFTALLQTLTSDPEMVNLIYNMPTANGNKHKDNNNDNIIKYLEFNRDNILNLAEKNYENIAEALTNNVIATATFSNS